MADVEDERTPRDINGVLEQLSQDIKSFCLHGDQVIEIEGSPDSSLAFYRDHVSPNKPLIVRGGIRHWKAFEDWQSDDYFRQKCGSKKVTVTLTPDGYADAIRCRQEDGAELFVMPHQMKMTVEQLLEELQAPSKDRVVYYQMQNSNLTDSEEWSVLLNDVDELKWASEAFGTAPDAVNFWMGDHRAVTSTHKDPYENIYCVVRGHKDIILFPPTDLPWLRHKSCHPAKYSLNTEGQFRIDDCDGEKVPWIEVDPLNPDLSAHPEYGNASPIKLRLEAGDVLYLPSLWFHHLSQSQGCVAVNFWYDMQFDIKYVYQQMLSNLVRIQEK